MKTDRKKDALIGENVMGWIVKEHKQYGWVYQLKPRGGYMNLPFFWEDIAAAWKVVQHMLEGANASDFGSALLDISGGRKCTTYADMVCAVLDAMTPGNICKAALKALGIPIEGGNYPWR